MHLKTVGTLFLLVIAAPAYSCQFDTDCNVGSKCVKNGYSINGICAGGLSPGNANDNSPVYDPLDLNTCYGNGSDGDARNKTDSDGTYGDTCSFDIDCGIGRKCVKGSGIYGVCM